MISPLTPYLSGDYNPESAQNYNLLLGISENEFCYLVTENDTLLAFGVKLPISQLATPLTLKGAHPVNYKQVIAGVMPRDFSIIPNELFDPAKAHEFAKYLKIEEGDKIFSQHVDSGNQIVFSCSKNIEDRLSQTFSAVKINFLYKGWLQAIARKQPFNNSLYINIQDNLIRIANFTDEKLRFYNRYAISDNNDIVYYIALVAAELGITQSDASLVLSGAVSANDDIVDSLKEFFRQVEISKISLLSHIPAEVEPQHVLVLSALQLCV
ncbi:DUF3822 family protein [Mucilaginibacter ginkgonis]|uniref:DUF3822 family protein n=1 Tax=Mucilaginibacter ginkgonis TaxID=2682091 RepID=A0A6I4HYR5_9SPHI|nr:DUF3822 family protein [Mucilaginibacter ginkgonis]QQL50397.1 DUF3822 family protein [Mucilaginibacter ginkgonis]